MGIQGYILFLLYAIGRLRANLLGEASVTRRWQTIPNRHYRIRTDRPSWTQSAPSIMYRSHNMQLLSFRLDSRWSPYLMWENKQRKDSKVFLIGFPEKANIQIDIY